MRQTATLSFIVSICFHMAVRSERFTRTSSGVTKVQQVHHDTVSALVGGLFLKHFESDLDFGMMVGVDTISVPDHVVQTSSLQNKSFA